MNVWWWVLLTFVCIGVQSFFSMLEMAVVSFNKVRLGYWVDKGMRRARWIYSLLQHPSRLFGTTLLGLNAALQVGSQCSREVYAALSLPPDLAWITQIILVMIFAELAPLFAARRYAERVAMLGVPLLYAISILVRPLIWLIGLITTSVNWMVGGPRGPVLTALSREELQHMVEGRDIDGGETPFNLLLSNIFSFRQKVAREVMTPLQGLHMLPNDATISAVADLLRQFDVPCVPLYFRSRRNVVGITFAKDLVTVAGEKEVREYARPPWFITQATPVGQILQQFRYNNQSVAVVLDHDGQTVGLLTLDDVLDELFGEMPAGFRPKPRRATRRRELIDKTLPGSMKIVDFNRDYGAQLDGGGFETLAHLLTHQLGHPPEPGESVVVGRYELTVVEASLMGARTVAVRSLT
jgi:putative hemolysin